MAPVPPNAGHRRDGKWLLAPVSDITTPQAGRICYGPAYWLVSENDEVMFFQTYGSPQCNAHERLISRQLTAEPGPNKPPAVAVRFFEMAYLPHRCSDYHHG